MLALTAAALAAPGDLDPSYGAGGTVTLPAGDGPDLAGPLLARSGAGTVVAQTVQAPYGSTSQVVVHRLDAQGHLDASFGTGGSTVLDLGRPAVVRDLAVTRDGESLLLLAVGDGQDGQQQLGLVRLLQSGLPAAGFGSGGVVVAAPAEGRAPVALLPRDDGSVLVGLGDNGQGSSDFAVQRFDAGGASTGAPVSVDLGGYDVLTDLVAGPSGSYYAVGYSAKPGGQSAAAVRLLPSGTPDPGYGANGIARVTSRGEVLAPVGAVAVDSSLLLYGAAQAGPDLDGFVARLSPLGRPAAIFAHHGLLLIGTPAAPETVTAIVRVGPDQVVASVAVQGGADSGLLAQFRIRTGALDASFGQAGLLPLPGCSFDELLADGDGYLLGGTCYPRAGPVSIVQRRLAR